MRLFMCVVWCLPSGSLTTMWGNMSDPKRRDYATNLTLEWAQISPVLFARIPSWMPVRCSNGHSVFRGEIGIVQPTRTLPRWRLASYFNLNCSGVRRFLGLDVLMQHPKSIIILTRRRIVELSLSTWVASCIWGMCSSRDACTYR